MSENLPDIKRDIFPPNPDEEEIEQSRAPLMDHLIELRNRVLWSVVSVLICTIGCWLFWKQIFQFLFQPYSEASAIVNGPNSQQLGLMFTAPMEALFAQLDVALFGGICLAFPIVAWQLYRFVAPGLYSHERKVFVPFLIIAPLLFFLGACMAYYIALPLIMQFSLRQQIMPAIGEVKVTYQGKVSEYVSLVTSMILIFGACFQLPIVQFLLTRAGIISGQAWLKSGRYAIFGVVLFAAFVAPPDVASQVILSVPIIILYYAGAAVARVAEKKEEAAGEV